MAMRLNGGGVHLKDHMKLHTQLSRNILTAMSRYSQQLNTSHEILAWWSFKFFKVQSCLASQVFEFFPPPPPPQSTFTFQKKQQLTNILTRFKAKSFEGERVEWLEVGDKLCSTYPVISATRVTHFEQHSEPVCQSRGGQRTMLRNRCCPRQE